MKILVVCQYYYPEQFRINDICESLVKEKHQVTVLTGLPNYPDGIVPKEYKHRKKRKECINGVKVIRCSEIARRKGTIFRILNYLSYMFSASLKAKFLREKYDIIYVYQLSPITMIMPAIQYRKRNNNIKIHLYCLDLWPESLLVDNFQKDSRIYKIIKKISIWFYKQCDFITVTSKKFIEYFQEELKIEKNIVYLPQYAENSFVRTKENNEKQSKGKTNLVFAGNIGKAQSVETIIKAASHIKDQNILFHIIGDGVSLENCKELTKELQLRNVFFYGKKQITKMQQYYDMADAMLITLAKNDIINKTIPGKLQSYMATGKPIIGAIDGEVYQIIKEAQCGYCVNAEDYIGLSNIIQQFHKEDKTTRDMMANRSYEYYQENFNKQNFIKKLLMMFKEEIENV